MKKILFMLALLVITCAKGSCQIVGYFEGNYEISNVSRNEKEILINFTDNDNNLGQIVIGKEVSKEMVAKFDTLCCCFDSFIGITMLLDENCLPVEKNFPNTSFIKNGVKFPSIMRAYIYNQDERRERMMFIVGVDENEDRQYLLSVDKDNLIRIRHLINAAQDLTNLK